MKITNCLLPAIFLLDAITGFFTAPTAKRFQPNELNKPTHRVKETSKARVNKRGEIFYFAEL